MVLFDVDGVLTDGSLYIGADGELFKKFNGFDQAITGCSDKLSALEMLLERIELGFDQVAFVGDDIIDIAVMHKVDFSIAPADAHEFTIISAYYVT